MLHNSGSPLVWWKSFFVTPYRRSCKGLAPTKHFISGQPHFGHNCFWGWGCQRMIVEMGDYAWSEHIDSIFGLSDYHQEHTSPTYSQRKNNPRQLHPHPQKQLCPKCGCPVPRVLLNICVWERKLILCRVLSFIKHPQLTLRHRHARFDWSHDHLGWTIRTWRRVHWSDESRFLLRPTDGSARVWHQRNTSFQDNHILGVGIRHYFDILNCVG
jgi:hypothetical protein